ncbi:uncharacterized protein J4E84_008052 [Alternaria hordeiaustralica]|uniref:uncharacterized protein n=1 Tax=Alternaria hordeiaustralica TaxID=1187925 RepID=UPI0020C35B93|nr:uncharacterized protein J4E84_008052 [Alternaria hordeiaustralica]KAI4680404.1 hypothetical protein J4E84_008052 [Alternaria hordeiaustralica]KAI4706611.1 hypothetical protein J4E89_008678 [Alternaria sp. Ai002NY15]
MHFPVPDPKRNRIAQACSGSVAPDVPSLLTIAPELRNQIYEYLLVEPCPITIEITTVEYTKTKVTKGTSTSIGSSAILRTCRQIYHEAVGLLYSRNAFRFQHNIQDDLFKVKIISPINVCKRWIGDIGSCLPKLRTISINLNVPEIPEKYEDWMFGRDVRKYSRQAIDVLPLLDVFWNSDTRNTSVMFEMAEDDELDDYESDFEEEQHDASSIANVLSELGKNDALDLQKTRRLLKSVYLYTSGTRGRIAYRSTDWGGSMWHAFEMSMVTRRYQIVPRTSPLTMFDLSYRVQDTITRLALGDHEFTYDFHNGVTLGQQPGMLKVNSQLRNLVAPSFLRQSRFTLLLRTGSIQSSKAMFKRLDSRVSETYAQTKSRYYESLKLCNPVTASKWHGNVPTIILQFQTSEAPHLAAVQIDAWDLLRVTSVFPANTAIIIRVCGGENEIQDHTTRLSAVRKDTYRLLKHLEPETAAETRKLSAQVELNKQCVPMRATIRRTGEGMQRSVVNMVKISDSADLVLLFDKRNPSWCKQLDSPTKDNPNLICFGWLSRDGDWDAWENKTMHDILWRLWHLCL